MGKVELGKPEKLSLESSKKMSQEKMKQAQPMADPSDET